MFKFNPMSVKKWNRIKSIKRGYYSFVIFIVLLFLSFFAEMLISNRALIVSYNDKIYLPTYGDIIQGTEFDEEYRWETNYRDLQKRFKKENKGDWVLMPLVPWNVYENDLSSSDYPPLAPNFETSHYLGTDKIGRDVLARLVYGFRIAIVFSLMLLLANYTLGIVIGTAMGFLGGKFDLIFQRIIEIW